MTDQPPLSAPGDAAPAAGAGAARHPEQRPARDRWSLASADAWTVVGRCQAILLGLVLLLGAVGVASDVATGGGGQAITSIAWIGGLAWLVHALATLVVGYPVGVAVSRLLPPDVSWPGATAAYALAGAACGAGVVLVLGGLADAPFPAAPWAGLGAVVAAGARAWAHPAIRRRHAAAAGPGGAVRG
ncbi:hypothetical protein [Cellulomonas sp.]|uniref:hypothetical protein n=1 Tax=Cellulomonas sp. TaxID=40001 RepID=UPI002D5111FA|nr:hypothetical protein [Cellulomonas sp.]HYQ75025.1 hypothetical protein [Cellulomonas sp.]